MRSSPMRALCGALLCLAALTIAGNAHAGKWVTKEIKWQISNQGGPDGVTRIWVRDTSHTAIGPVDTTGDFSLDDASPPPRGMGAPASVAIGGANGESMAQNDTTTIAWVVLQSDSSAAPTSGLTGVTMLVDGRVGGYGPAVDLARGWVKADSALITGAAGKTLITGNESIGLPIRTISPYGNVLRWGTFRARISATGTAMSAVRAFVRYWKED